MKKFINEPNNVVDEMLDGLVVLRPDLVRISGYKILLRADMAKEKEQRIAIISGGGSGHEPAHAGYVGKGMLSAAVLGEVFTSPDAESALAAIREVSGSGGVLLVVKNYTGDRLNFGIAAEMARAEGIPVKMVVVNDDVALRNSVSAVGARGLAGTVLIHKIAGAAAAEGKSLEQVAAIARDAVGSLVTIGVSFSAGISPSVGKPSFELGDHEIELGLGIHGEPGVARSVLEPADQLVEKMIVELADHGAFDKERRVAVMVNNLGSTTNMELAIVARHATRALAKRGFRVARIYAGTFLTSLDMAGISISLLGVNDDRLAWLDAPTSAPAWPKPLLAPACKVATARSESPLVPVNAPFRTRPQDIPLDGMKEVIEAACVAIINAEDELTELDRVTGDGDLGTNLKRAAVAVRDIIVKEEFKDASSILKTIGHTLRRSVGGTSGPLYGAFFLRAGTVLEKSNEEEPLEWVEALEAGCIAIGELGGAGPGDRTMLDALIPFVDSLKTTSTPFTRGALEGAVQEAERGTAATAQMLPRFGRSSYLGSRSVGSPDPGARAVAIWLRAIFEAVFPGGSRRIET